MKINLGTISNFNKKFYGEAIKQKKYKKALDVLNFNKDVILKDVIGSLKRDKELYNLIPDIVEEYNSQKDSKIIEYTKGALQYFYADIDNDPDSEMVFSVPVMEEDVKNPLASVTIKIDNKTNIKIARVKMIKQMWRTNGVKIEEDIKEITENSVTYTFTSIKPWNNYLFWKTISAFNRYVLRVKG